MAKINKDDLERFESKIWAEPNSGCWLWGAGTDKDGYGKIKIKRKHLRAHRVSYELHKGPIPAGMQVCHTCDNPSCVNPDHLWLGNNKDNQLDCVRKLRHGRQKLTPKQYRELEYLANNTTMSNKELAEKFNIGESSVWATKYGVSNTTFTNKKLVKPGLSKGEKHAKTILKNYEVIDIKTRIKSGEALVSIHKDYPHIKYHNLVSINIGRSWGWINV